MKKITIQELGSHLSSFLLDLSSNWKTRNGRKLMHLVANREMYDYVREHWMRHYIHEFSSAIMRFGCIVLMDEPPVQAVLHQLEMNVILITSHVQQEGTLTVDLSFYKPLIRLNVPDSSVIDHVYKTFSHFLYHDEVTKVTVTDEIYRNGTVTWTMTVNEMEKVLKERASKSDETPLFVVNSTFPGSGKSTVIEALHERGLLALDGDLLDVWYYAKYIKKLLDQPLTSIAKNMYYHPSHEEKRYKEVASGPMITDEDAALLSKINATTKNGMLCTKTDHFITAKEVFIIADWAQRRKFVARRASQMVADKFPRPFEELIRRHSGDLNEQEYYQQISRCLASRKPDILVVNNYLNDDIAISLLAETILNAKGKFNFRESLIC